MELKCDTLHSSFAFNLNLRRYMTGTDLAMHNGLLGKLEKLGGWLASGDDQAAPGEAGEGSRRCTTGKHIESAIGEDFYALVVRAILHAADLSNSTLVRPASRLTLCPLFS